MELLLALIVVGFIGVLAQTIGTDSRDANPNSQVASI
jgi:hypothetical protein